MLHGTKCNQTVGGRGTLDRSPVPNVDNVGMTSVAEAQEDLDLLLGLPSPRGGFWRRRSLDNDKIGGSMVASGACKG